MKFTDLGLDDVILKAVFDEGYTQPTPIQEQAIPNVLIGRDVMAAAQTGTGKTASFTLPMLHRLLPHANSSTSPAKHPVRALILTPTRELAAQIDESVRRYGKYLPLKVGCVYGGVPMPPQVAMLRSGVEVLVATPGRLLDHVGTNAVRFSSIEFLVLDEADRMLDMGFLPDIKRIVDLIPATRQTLLFSATYSEDIRRVVGAWLRDPVKIEVAARNTVTDTIQHTVLEVSEQDKSRLLVRLLHEGKITQALVFCNTKIGANRLTRQLQNKGVDSEAIHSDRSQMERTAALENFKANRTKVLVATDVAARGLDIEQLPYVVNYDLPYNAEDYVHRIGRTGRAGQKGEAISFCTPEDKESLRAIEKLINKKLELIAPIKSGFDRAVVPTPASAPSRVLKRDVKTSKGDSFFSQPYQPSDSVSGTSAPVVGNKEARLEKDANKKPIAALFMPPSIKHTGE
ncbi:MAG: DEAD/DEAH box helicase [Proteobacteria bacterium]|nr:DEAD/DEAH box helicase [Pseudomonadota bacterium]MDA1332154.1 DEAD/DEAH box helicase [Pseudomonadota bacterium]